MYNTDYRSSPFEQEKVQIACIMVTFVMIVLSIVFGTNMTRLMNDVNDKMSIVAHNTYLMCNTTRALNPFEYSSYCMEVYN